MNKKAMALYYPVITGFVVGLAIFYISSMMKQPEHPSDYVGQLSLDVLRGVRSIEGDLFFVRGAGKYSTFQSVYDLGINGGFYSESGCGKYIGLNYWIAPRGICFLEDTELRRNLGKYLNENMKAGRMLTGISDRKRIAPSDLPMALSATMKSADFTLITPARTIRAGLTHIMAVITR